MKKRTLSQQKQKTWEAFSLYIRLRDAYRTTGDKYEVDCITCGKRYPATGKGCVQAGHFIPGRKSAYLFDERQVNAQCFNCNMRLKGNWPPYLEVMIKRHGQAAVDEMLYKQRNEIYKFTIPELEMKEEQYKQYIKLLPGAFLQERVDFDNTEL